MGSIGSNVWHQVHAQREDGVAAMFLIRDVEPRADQPKIFVIELPYAVTDLSGQPDAAGYHRLGAFQEQWLEPACSALGWTFVAWKSEDGSFFLYLYGAGDPDALLEKLAPFDGDLGFFNDLDADWSEYAALRELVEQAQAHDGEDGEDGDEGGHVHTDACDHDHDHDGTSHGIDVIDLSGAPWPGTSSGSEVDVVEVAEVAEPGDDNGDSRSAVARSEARAAAGRSARRVAIGERGAPRSTQRKPAAAKAVAKARKPAPRRASGASARVAGKSKPAAGKPSKPAAASKPSKPAAAARPAASRRTAATRRARSGRATRR